MNIVKCYWLFQHDNQNHVDTLILSCYNQNLFLHLRYMKYVKQSCKEKDRGSESCVCNKFINHTLLICKSFSKSIGVAGKATKCIFWVKLLRFLPVRSFSTNFAFCVYPYFFWWTRNRENKIFAYWHYETKIMHFHIILLFSFYDQKLRVPSSK